MKWFVLLTLCFVFKYAKTLNQCKGIYVRGKFYKKHLIANGINRPYQLSIYNQEQNIYFSYNVGSDDEDKFEVGCLKRHETVPTPLTSVKNGFATAIDENNKLLYIGGSEGIFSVDLTNPNDIKHVIKGHDIWDMFLKEHLYFIEYQSQRLHKKTENGSELVDHIKERVYQFAIDGDDDIFITTDSGLHEIKNGTKERILYESPKAFRAIEIDRKGVAYFCAKSTIYVANKHNHTLEEIAHIKNVFGLTFDAENNIIYSDPHEIVKLLPEDC